MQAPYYGLGSLSAATYDAVELGLSGPVAADVRIYRDLLGPRPRSCLEVGCGTGRLTWLLAADGHQIHGLDISPGMLEIARSKAAAFPSSIKERVRFSHGDARHYELSGSFDFVLVSFFCLNHLDGAADWTSALRAAAQHLQPDGRIIAHVLGAGFLDQPTAPETLAREHVTLNGEDGRQRVRISVCEREINRANGRYRQLNRFELLGKDDQTVVDSREWLELSWLDEAGIRACAEEAGLRIADRRDLRMVTAGNTVFYMFSRI